MTYRTRLAVIFLGTTLVTNAVGMAIMVRQSRHWVYEEMRAKALSIAASTASLIDGERHKLIHSDKDETSPVYRDLKTQLRSVRDANRRDDTWVKDIFTLRPSARDQNVLLFGVDPEESAEGETHVGQVHHVLRGRKLNVDRLEADDGLTTDERGTWLSANAPFRDRAGRVVGAVVVEIPAQRVALETGHILASAGVSTVLGVLLALAATLVLARWASRPLEDLREVVEAIGKGNLEARAKQLGRDEFGQVGRAVNEMVDGLKEREIVKASFARYVSRQVMDSIIRSGEVPTVRGDRRRVTVMFCDIRGFTTLAETMPPEEVVQLLNEYFAAMVEVIFRNNGTLDKFIGDGLMVLFGAPDDDLFQEENAIRAALEMQGALRRLRDKWMGQGGPEIRIGVGINSGTAVVGHFGSSERLEYTAIGDTVNLASRLETATKELGVEILVSEYTYSAVRGTVRATRMGPVQVKGRTEEVVAYAVEGLQAPRMARELAGAV
ncbi:MAG TPA: adenylate/guanylate cyclase domain-containing protein [Armatimonadota bacterium]|nr:adenylate/guanylate cyclase domain-containing protein [Armatimonadota bacterium]